MSEAQFKLKDSNGTISVYTRQHLPGCKYLCNACDGRSGETPCTHNPNQNNCACPKWFYENRKSRAPVRRAANTPSFSEACRIADDIHQGWHPEIAKARALVRKSNDLRKTFSEAIDAFIGSKKSEGLVESTLEQYRSILGGKCKDGSQRGHLLEWLDRYNSTRAESDRLEHIEDTLTSHVDELKTWLTGRTESDVTKNGQWGFVKTFFNWAHEKGYTTGNPSALIKAPKVKKGNRCGAFTDEQYNAILASIDPWVDTVTRWPAQERIAIKKRLRLFIEVMRYGGLALIDAVAFSPFINNSGLGLDDSGVLRYRRVKTNELAIVPIENERLLREIKAGIPLEKWSDPRRPFAPVSLNLKSKKKASVTQMWAKRLKNLYAVAGITLIETEVGTKKAPHSHMFRDTFVKWHLKERHTDIRDVAKMLGHYSLTTTERYYASWMEDDQLEMIKRVRASRPVENVVSMPVRRKTAAAGD